MLRGSLQAALVARWFAVWLLAAPAGHGVCLAVHAALQPDLCPAAPGHGVRNRSLSGWRCWWWALLGWLAWQLGREPVRAARAARNLKPWSMTPRHWWAWCWWWAWAWWWPAAQRRGCGPRPLLAQQQVTPDYRLHVRSVSKTRSGQGTRITATVTAWTDSDIKTVPVQWQEP